MKHLFLATALLLLTHPAFAGVEGDLRSGSRLYEKGKYGQALQRYTEALQAEPDNQQAVFNVGAAYYRLKDYTQAEIAFDQAAAQTGERTQDALFNLGNSYFRANNKEQSVDALRKAVLMNPQDKEAIHNLQYVLQQKGSNNNNNQDNQNDQQNKSDSPNQNQQQQQNQGQSPQQQDEQEQPPQPNALPKDDADRVLQMAKENEFKPQKPGDRARGDDSVEKDW